MKANMGKSDRMFRLLVVVAILAAYLFGMISGLWATIGLIVAAVFLLTSLVGVCPAYLPFGLSTLGKK